MTIKCARLQQFRTMATQLLGLGLGLGLGHSLQIPKSSRSALLSTEIDEDCIISKHEILNDMNFKTSSACSC